MHLVEKHIVKPSNELYPILDELCFKSKNLYNKANYIIRQVFIETGKEVEEGKREKAKWIRYHELQKMLQNSNDPDYTALPRNVSQQVLLQLDRDWKSFFQSIKEWKNNPSKFKRRPSLPKYKHKKRGRNILVYTLCTISKVELRNSVIKLAKSDIRIKTKQKNIQQVRIVPLPYKSYKVEVIYEKEVEKRNVDKSRVASIDVGVDNLAAVTSNVKEFRPLIINGRPLKAINQYYNKRKAELLSKLMKQDENRRTSNRINRLTMKRNNKIEDYMHKASRLIVDLLVEHNIGTLVIGKNDGWKQEVNMGDRNNQNFVLIPHSKFIKMLEYKCRLKGIDVILIDESYTSKCSLIDLEDIGKKKTYMGRRISRSLFKSKDGIIINADINGSGNIMRKAIPNCLTTNGIEGLVVSPVRLNPRGFYPYKQVS
jgi:putative transposase